MIKTYLYQQAVASVLSVAQKTQAALDQAAVEARCNNQAAVQVAATKGISKKSAAYPIAVLLAQTIMIGRDDDGYPAVRVPKETWAVIDAGFRSGIIPKIGGYITVGDIQFYSDGGVYSTQCVEQDIDYRAWNAACEYKNKQTVSSL